MTKRRSKTGTMFKNTIIWRLIKLVWKSLSSVCSSLVYGLKYIVRNTKLMWKYILAFAAISMFELFVAVGTWYGDFGEWFTFFLLIKIAIFAFMLKALVDMNRLKKAGIELAGGNSEYKVDTEKMYWEFKSHGNELNCIGDGIKKAVNESLKSERMKTELITNVSHDIKTPLTSIINYVDLLKKEDIQGETANEYIEVLDRQSERLKKLIEDLIEASKASTGNMTVTLENVDAGIMLGQAIGEFSDRLNARGLKVVESSKARNTEGSGLGLSIAQNLMELMNGELNIIVDGDLFKVVLLLNVSEV